MGFRKKYQLYKHTITIKRSIEIDDSLREWIFKNSNYRRKVWNDFVEEYYKCKKENKDFNVMEYKKWYYHNIEEPNHTYDTYTIGISEQVMKDMILSLKLCKSQHGSLHFKKFDRFKCSFKVSCKPTFRNKKMYGFPTSFNSRVRINYDFFEFRDNKENHMFIKTKEPIFSDVTPVDDTIYFRDKNYYYAFSEEDIKEISFVHELGRFYVILFVNVINTYSRKRESYKRKELAGIDLGIHNPVCISDDESEFIIRMSDKELKRINYLERRCKKLQVILGRKTKGSKNYNKVLRKLRICGYKIRNVRLNWRRNLGKELSITYKNICVDTYRIPRKDDQEPLPRSVIKRMNYKGRMHGMYDFSEHLKHTSWKYHCHYYPSPEKTTITCSRCGFINKPLSLSQRTLECEGCGFSLDRDLNASRNCYKYLVLNL